MTIPSWIKSLSVFVLLMLNNSARAADTSELMEEALNQWPILEKAGSQLESSYTLSVRYQKQEIITRMKVLFGGADHVWIYSEELKKRELKNPPLEKVVGKNPSYAFRLSRRVGEPEYALNYVGPNESNLEQYLTGMISGHSGIPWSFHKNLSSLVKDSGFQLQKMTREQQDGKDIVKLIARYAPADGENQPMSDVNIILDPNRYWCILAFSFRVSWGRTSGTVDYGPDDHGLPVPIRYTMTQNYDKGGQTVYETVFESWKYRRDKIPEKDFYLSAFGLPEPMGVKLSDPPRIWLWLLAAAFAAATLALLFAWLKRRRALTNQMKT